jgi:hypothetical protein
MNSLQRGQLQLEPWLFGRLPSLACPKCLAMMLSVLVELLYLQAIP